MKKSTIQTILIILACLLFCLAGCKESHVQPRDYQIELTNDSLIIYDGSRRVGATKWEETPTALDSIFLNDNL